jgi:hypothetical protein
MAGRRLPFNVIVDIIGIEKMKEFTAMMVTQKNIYTEMNARMTYGVKLNTQNTKSLERQNFALESRINAGKTSIHQLAQEIFKNRELTAEWEHRLEVETRAIGIKREMTGVSIEYARYLAEEEIAVEKLKMEEEEAAGVMMRKKRMILSSTMAIFGMTMSIWQLTNALSAMAGENKELKSDFQKMQAMMMGATGPLLLFHGILQLTTAQVTKLGAAMLVLLPVSLAIASGYLALTAKSKELRIAAGALSGALFGLTAAKIYHNVVTAQGITLTYQEITAKIMSYAVTSLGTLLPVIAGAIAGGIAVAALVPEAQTGVGQWRYAERTGLIKVHEGEGIGRVTEPMEGGIGGGPSGGDVYLDGDLVGVWLAKKFEEDKFVGA